MKILYRILGIVMVGLGFLGILLPVLPTTPFLLLALWFFTRSSRSLKHWLLTNRLFGKYISDFHNGHGIPSGVKVFTITLLWLTITCSALFAVEQLWLRLLLFTIAAGVTVHILHIKTKRTIRRIVVLSPTREEIAHIAAIEGVAVHEASNLPSRRRCGKIPVVICGVGMAETAAAATVVIRRLKPDMMVLCGIAGAYPASGLSVGDCVVVASERVADQGAFRGGRFVPLYTKQYDCEYALRLPGVRLAAGCTVCSAASDFADVSGGMAQMGPNCGGAAPDGRNDVSTIAAGFETLVVDQPTVTERNDNICPVGGAETDGGTVGKVVTVSGVGKTGTGADCRPEFAPGMIENMEGAAFFAVCKACGVPFLEIRAVSNIVAAPRSQWRMDVAVRALAETLNYIIDEIKT